MRHRWLIRASAAQLAFAVALFPAAADAAPLPRFDRVVLLEQTAETSANVGASPTPYGLAVRDMNKDEYADIIVGHVVAPSAIYLNECSGRGYTRNEFGDSKGTVYGFAIADLDKDGQLDIAAARCEAPNASGHRDLIKPNAVG